MQLFLTRFNFCFEQDTPICINRLFGIRILYTLGKLLNRRNFLNFLGLSTWTSSNTNFRLRFLFIFSHTNTHTHMQYMNFGLLSIWTSLCFALVMENFELWELTFSRWRFLFSSWIIKIAPLCYLNLNFLVYFLLMRNFEFCNCFII